MERSAEQSERCAGPTTYALPFPPPSLEWSGGRNRTPKGGTILQLRQARPGLRAAVADAIQGTLPLFTLIVGCEPILFTLTGDLVRLAEWVAEKTVRGVQAHAP